jgi:hypothetical protein
LPYPQLASVLLCDMLYVLLQVACRGKCYVPGSFAWALACLPPDSNRES